MKTKLLVSSVAGALCMAASTALADTSVSAITDLNVRAGPGPQYPVIGVLAAGQKATLNGCVANSKWCTIAEDSGQGWIYSDYVTAEFGGNQMILTQRPSGSGVAVVKPSDATAVAGGVTGAIVGAVVGGPVGAVVGGAAGTVAGGATGSMINPPTEVRSYVTTHRADPVYLEGEVVTGATLPETVELREIPDYQYRYVNVNGQPVLVEPKSRRIVYVMR